ncbi:DUF317 domain-containing protein [Streptomyces silvensis]|uniref:DUF317 domain-containing protein n=1 Tax=Streptomyces silvensis TaxID=1765722 RepID=A0A0W7X1W6_9ACTN|nr:DUF317 domain-containing protein [Streptomyces silvensis]KUF16853.1 hypothetical protein AT728_23380 [Streptomyces silvensis]
MKKQQWSGRGADAGPAEQHYLVQPRYLAGGGDLGYVSEFLRASGWKDKSQAGGPLIFDSPDGTVRIGYDPYIQPGGWAISGTARAGQEAWHATLGRQVPVEIVAGFTDALTRPPAAHAPNVWAPLAQQRWAVEQGQHVTAMSPQGGAWLQFHQSTPGQALWWAGARTEHGPSWTATFTTSTPVHLVAAFSAALADPQPVMRPRGHVPPSQRIRTQSVSVRPDQLSAWQQTRITAARAASWARNSWATTRPRRTPAAGAHAAAGGRAHR